MIYCLSCKRKTPNNNLSAKISKNKKPYVLAKCSVCGKNKSKFLSIKEIQANFLKIFQF